MYKIIAIILVAAAVTLLLFHNYIIDKDTTNTTLAYIHKNNQLIASVLALAGYFAYTQSQSELSTVPSTRTTYIRKYRYRRSIKSIKQYVLKKHLNL